MSNAKRKGLEFTANQIGNAFKVIDNLVGDSSTPGSNALKFENNLLRLKGSVLFQDYDLSKKDPMNIQDSDYNTFNSSDVADFVIQGANLTVEKILSNFSNTSSWSPSRYSPPSPEGWGIYDYNAWSNYIPQYNSSGTANTLYVIYNPFLEPYSGISRTTFSYPIRYTGTADIYSRVPLFDFASWISLKNTGNTTTDEIELIFPKKYLSGISNLNPYNNCPSDLLFYSHRFLSSSTISDPITLDGTMGVMNVSDELDVLAYQIQESNGLGNTISNDKNYYKVNIRTPNSLSWNTNDWLHVVAYWGSFDSEVDSLKQSYIPTTNNKISIGSSEENNLFYFYPKKSFFNKNIFSSIGFSKSGINDSSVYLYSSNNYNYVYRDGKFISNQYPFRYKLNETIENISANLDNSLLNLKNIEEDQFLPIVLAVKNSGNFYDEPELEIEVFTGDVFTTETAPSTWSDFKYYPVVSEDYKPICNIICKNTLEKNRLSKYINNSSYVLNDLSIVHIEMLAENVIKNSLADADVTYNFTSAFNNIFKSIRLKQYTFILNYIGQRLIARFSRYNLAKIFNSNQFISLSTSDYKTLHNLSKIPSDLLLQQENNIEPKAIQYSQNASDLISKFSQIPPSVEFGGLASSSLYLNDIAFDKNAEFEVYLPEYNSTVLNENDNNQGLEKDYTFRINFKNTSNEHVIKDLYVNASKYLLSDYEYDTRVAKKLDIDGYFKSSTLENIRDFNIYSYSGLIPDIKKEQFRKIENKQNQPVIFDRLTESEFESIKLIENPNITKDEIIRQKTGFGLTDSFYVIDTSKPSEFYNTISNLGLTISNYSNNKNPYWVDNSKVFYGNDETSIIQKAKNIKDLRYDSFNLAGAGFSTNDNSINQIENIFDQRILASTASTVNQKLFYGTKKISSNKFAFKIYCDEIQDTKSFKVKLSKNSNFYNYNAKIKALLYSSKDDLPFELLAIGNEISTNDINNNLSDFYFELNYKFFKNKIYWVVLDISQLPPTYDPYNFGLINVNDTSITGVLDIQNNVLPDFNRYVAGVELGIGSTIGDNINTWYAITSIGSTLSMSVASTGQTLNKQPYSIRYSFNVGIAETSLSGASLNSANYSISGWAKTTGTPFVEFYSPEVEIYASMNRDFTDSNINLPPPNKYRETDNLKVDEFWSFQCKDLEDYQLLYFYPRALKLNRIDVLGSGNVGTNIISIGSTNYSEKILVGMGLTGSYFSAGTSITNIIYDSSSSIYNLYLSSNVSSSFANTTVGIGKTEFIYLKRSNDIFMNVKYSTDSGIFTTTITLDKSPTWITQWYSKSKKDYLKVNTNVKSNIITTNYNLDFQNYKISDSSNYINGYSFASFKVKAGLGTTFDFRFKSSGGIRIKVDDESGYSLDKWQTTSSTGFTFSKILAADNSDIKFEVYFNNNITSIGQTLIGEWRKTGLTSWQNIDDSFYEEVDVEPILLSDNKIKNISFISVGKDSSIFTSPNFGQPINDSLVIRSK